MGVIKAFIGVVPVAFMVFSHSLDDGALVFLPFLTFYPQSALAEMPRTRDLAIFVRTMTMTNRIFVHAHVVKSRDGSARK